MICDATRPHRQTHRTANNHYIDGIMNISGNCPLPIFRPTKAKNRPGRHRSRRQLTERQHDRLQPHQHKASTEVASATLHRSVHRKPYCLHMLQSMRINHIKEVLWLLQVLGR